MNYSKEILLKWENLINACKLYYIDSQPTGLLDSEFDELEKKAIEEDGFYARDYVFNTFMQGVKTQNRWIEKITKVKVSSTSMIKAIELVQEKLGENIYCDLKYDGSSLAIYLDPETGKPVRIVTVGNLNLNNLGVDQTWKLIHFLPHKFPKGIVAIQAEALIDLQRLPEGVDPERARQKANGLINSKFCDKEINSYLTIRAYRYYVNPEMQEGIDLLKKDYREVLGMFETTVSEEDGHILFSPAHVWTVQELQGIVNQDPSFTESDRTFTPTGTFLNDGWVIYRRNGTCECALKFAMSGENTESTKTTVRAIQWNSQVSKGKDSWSANVIIDPINIKGCTVKKPSAGSVTKLVKNNITPGAIVKVVLANSTIPMVGDVYSPGNGDFQWPTCSCGYRLSDKDIYGSNLKCGNPECSERYNRMVGYLKSLKGPDEVDLNKLLVIDRFKWEDTTISIETLINLVSLDDSDGYYSYLLSFLKTDLQKRNLDLVWRSSFKAFYELLK